MTGPARPPQAPPRPGGIGTGPRVSAPGALSVVVADDDAHWRELAAEPFRKRGDAVRATSDGLQALAMCVDDPPDVLLSDVQMPRMDGWQLLRMVRARRELATLPVIFMTSLDSDSARLKGYQLGVDAYVPKPFQPEELLIRVHKLLRNKRSIPPQKAEPVVLKGELEHVSPPSLLSFLAVEKRTGVLLFVGERVARLMLRDGRVLRAELEGVMPRPKSREVLSIVLEWTQGQFELTEEPVSVMDEVCADVSVLLIEHARMIDEKGR